MTSTKKENEYSLEEKERLNGQEIYEPPEGWGKRHVQIALSSLAFGVTFSILANLNVAMIAMTDIKGNKTNSEVFDWDKKTQNLVMASFFLGFALMMIPAGSVSTRFSPKKIVVVTCICGSVLSLAFPFAAKIGGAYAACACRFILGSIMSTISPCTFTMIGKWVPLNERGRAIAYSQTGGQFGKVLGIASAGWLSSTFIGWKLVFYVTALFSAAVGMLFIFFGASSPDEHPTISKEELIYIKKYSGTTEKKKLKTPWKPMLTSVQVLIIMINFIGYLWTINTMIVETPSYLKNILGMEIKSGGVLSSLPFAALGIMSAVYSSIFDFFITKNKLSVSAARKASNTIGFWLSGLLLVIFPFIPATQPAIAICMLTAAASSVGAGNSGFLVAQIDIAPNFSGITMAVANTIGSFAAFLAPLTSGAIITDATNINQWRIVFIIAAVIMFVGNLLFLVFGTSDVQPWNNLSKDTEVSEDSKELQTFNTDVKISLQENKMLD